MQVLLLTSFSRGVLLHGVCYILLAHYFCQRQISNNVGPSQATAQALVPCPFTAGARARSEVSQCGICGGQSGTWTEFSASVSVVPSQYHSTRGQFSFIHVLQTLYNLSI